MDTQIAVTRIVLRILFFPFNAAIMLIMSIYLYLKGLYQLLRYGGENIIYNNRIKRGTIINTYERLQDIIELLDQEKLNHDTNTK